MHPRVVIERKAKALHNISHLIKVADRRGELDDLLAQMEAANGTPATDLRNMLQVETLCRIIERLLQNAERLQRELEALKAELPEEPEEKPE